MLQAELMIVKPASTYIIGSVGYSMRRGHSWQPLGGNGMVAMQTRASITPREGDNTIPSQLLPYGHAHSHATLQR